MIINQCDPKASFLAHRAEIQAAIEQVLESGRYILGEQVAAFEREFAIFLGQQYVVGVASGTDALVIGLKACGIGPGDVVITVSHTAVATVAAIELTGASAYFVEIDPKTYTLDLHSLEETLRTSPLPFKAIIPVHIYGHPVDMPSVMKLAEQYNLKVIEDCAQSHGASLNGKTTGTWGDVAAYSFYPTKNLAALGDGGAISTDNPEIAEKARNLREYGWKARYVSDYPGLNSRLDEIQAAVLRVKLRYLPIELKRRNQMGSLYQKGLKSTSLHLPTAEKEVFHVYHQYVVRSGQRDQLKSYLDNRGIGTGIHYPIPVHLQPAYNKRVPIAKTGLGHTELAAKQILSLPMHPYLSDSNLETVANAVSDFERST